MSDQLALFAEPRARASDPDTSREAAEAVSHSAARQECRIMERFAMFGPMTDEELVMRSPQWREDTLKSARSRLKNRGLLIADGKRKNSRGKNMTIWRLP
jgi:hypothetical protein